MTPGEIAGLINAAGTEIASARMSVTQALDALERARQAVGEVLGESQSNTLWDYSGGIGNAESKCNSAIFTMEGCLDIGQAYISQLYS